MPERLYRNIFNIAYRKYHTKYITYNIINNKYIIWHFYNYGKVEFKDQGSKLVYIKLESV